MTITAVPAVRRRNAALIAAESGVPVLDVVVPVLDVVVPVFNEQAVLADSIHRLHRHLREDFPFSFRPYCTVALAPAVAALIGISVRELALGKQFAVSRWVLAAIVFVTGLWNFVLLDRPDWLPWLRWVVLVGSIVVAAVLAAGGHRLGSWTATLAVAGLVAGLGGTAAYTVETVLNTHGGGVPISGPSRPGGLIGFGGTGGPGGSEVQASDNAEVKALLRQAGNRWAAATVGSHAAGSLELSTGASVMLIGGFSGGDNSPTLQQFQDDVAGGQIHYFIVSNGPGGDHGPGGESGSGTEITQWVQRSFTAQDVGGTEIYDLTGAG